MAKFSENKFDILSKLKDTPSRDNFDFHYWSDFIELKCFFNADQVFSKDDFLDCLKSNNDFNSKDNRRFFNVDYEKDDDAVFPELEDKALKNDRDEEFANECFRLIESRTLLFGESYPFFLSKNRRALFHRKRLSWKQRSYIFLLFSSTLKYLSGYQSVLTKSFEVFSLFVLKSLLPPKAEAHLFGSGNSIIKDRRYQGHVWEKLNKLKLDLNEIVIKAKREDFPRTDSGDSGFDFIAWVPNGDNQSHMITFTGQAACTSNWYDKKYTSSSSALRSLIPVSVPPINIVFIPFCVRQANWSWNRAHDIGECVLIDRYRLLYHFKNNGKVYLDLPCDKVVLNLLKIKESPMN